jgi:DNA (cytosine-5)-methyltransferase 1
MTHGSLFSGIGGFDLAAEWMGWENKFHCEWNTFGQKVLHHYWPQAEQFTDITKTDFKKYANRIDILTGGFPCQPYSSAGKRLGKEDERHLWPEMLRCIQEVQPRWVVGENVLGLVNWSGGLVFHEVQADLEAEGYEVQPYVLPAVSVNAPHRRDRVWFVAFNTKSKRDTKIGGVCQRKDNESIGIWQKNGNVANTNSNGLNQCNSNNEVNTSQGRFNALGDTYESNGDGITSDSNNSRTNIGMPSERERSQSYNEREGQSFSKHRQNGSNGDVANPNSTNSQTRTQRQILGQSDWEKTNGHSNVERRNQWQNFPSVSPICTGDDGISDRLDSITFPKWRNESIKAGGNAIVPQVVYQIFKTIEQYERINTPDKNS